MDLVNLLYHAAVYHAAVCHAAVCGMLAVVTPNVKSLAPRVASASGWASSPPRCCPC